MREAATLTEALAGRLKAEIDPAVTLLLEDEERRIYARDLGEVPPLLERALLDTTPDLVVQPRCAEDVLRVVRFADREGIPIVPRGVASWGFGGCVPVRRGIVFDFSTWMDVGPVDIARGAVSVAPGARWGEIEKELQKKGFTLGVYPSNRFATVGGWIATGGYGLMSGGHGHVKEWIEELTIVTPAHGVRTIRPGDRAFDLFFGSEGQLGVLSGATVRGRPAPSHGSPRLLLSDDAQRLLRFLSDLLASGIHVGHAKYLDAAHVGALCELWDGEGGGSRPPLCEPSEALLLYFDDAKEERKYLERAADAASSGIREAPFWVANYLWEDRFNPLRVQLLGPSLLASESVVPLASLPRYLERSAALALAYDATIYMEAHLVREGDHHAWLLLPMIPCDKKDGARYARLLTLVSLLTRAGVAVGGRPYGVGIWNTPFVRHRFSAAELRELRRMKEENDPRAVLNPGKFFAIHSRLGGVPGLLLHRRIVMPGLAIMDKLLPLLSPLLRAGAKRRREIGRPGRYPIDMSEPAFLEKVLDGCTRCGNCAPVCPAYQVSRHEGTTARAKLDLAGKILGGQGVTKHESDTAFICTHCGECERVCQTHLPLVRAWDALEAELARRHGRPEEKIRVFVDGLGTNPAYLNLIGSAPYTSGAAVAAPARPAPTWAPRVVASGKVVGGNGDGEPGRRLDPWARVSLPKAASPER